MKKKSIFEQFYQIARSEFKSDTKLAENLGITKSTFGQYKRKINPVSPSLSTIEKWCDKLNIDYVENIFKKK